MAYVICEPCIGVKDQACVAVCPVDCIHPASSEEGFAGSPQLFIDPQSCINCGACESECPVSAIFQDLMVPEKWQHYIEGNRRYYEAPAP